MTAPQLMTSAEVAALFGVGIGTVAVWARDGSLRSIRTPGGRDRRFPAAQPLIAAALAYRDGKGGTP